MATVVGAVTALAASPALAATVSQVPASSWFPWKACPSDKVYAKENCAQVRAVAVGPSGTTYLGGDFTHMRRGSESRSIQNLAALDSSGNIASGFATHTFNGVVRDIATDGSSVYVGGAFTKVDGSGAARVAKFDATTGARRSYTSAVSGPVWAVELANNRLYIGGKFTSVQGVGRNNAAALDPATGKVDGRWNPNATLIANDTSPNDSPKHNDIPVRDIVADPTSTRVYLAGDMDLLADEARPAIAAVDATTGARDTSFTPGSQVNKSFQGMQVALADSSGGRTPGVVLAAGGLTNRSFTMDLAGSVRWVVNADGDMQAAAVVGDSLFLGGHFTEVCRRSCYDSDTSDDVARRFVAAFPYSSSSTPSPDPDWAPHLGPTSAPYYYGVWTLRGHQGSLYAGGVFKEVRVNGTVFQQGKLVRFSPS